MHQFYQFLKRKFPFCYQVSIEHWKCSFHPYDTEGAPRKSFCLFLCTVRGMICSDHIDSPIPQCFQQCSLIFFSLDRRIHLEPSVIFDIIPGKHQIMRRRFTGDIQSFRLGAAHQLHRFSSGNVTDVIAASCFSYQPDVPLKLFPFTL